jgi:hypothetical protein
VGVVLYNARMKKPVIRSQGWTIRLGLLVALVSSVTLGACSKDKKLIAACEKANSMTTYMKQHPTPEGACKTCLESLEKDMKAAVEKDPETFKKIGTCPGLKECTKEGQTDCGCLVKSLSTDDCKGAFQKRADITLKCADICK